jgi:hypothetical protein
VVASLPSNKSPGPDGFNMDFIKKCWPIIKGDFYNLGDAFYSGTVCLEGINGSYITLIPKVDAPSKVSDLGQFHCWITLSKSSQNFWLTDYNRLIWG